MRIPVTVAFCACLGFAPAVAGEPVQSDEPKSGVIVTVPPEAHDRVADEAGEIYTTRGYKGVVPGIRDQSDVPAKKADPEAAPEARPVVEWVGFQPFSTYSRVFIQVTGNFAFSVTRPAQDRIEVRIPSADVSTTNDLHELLTRNFPTAVDKVTVTTSADDGGTVVIGILLKAPVGYLYRQDGAYVFVDVEL
ncbi:MAG TPA: hypothetical protein PK313_15305 [Myxococcota bacterium]|jgi:hypothetical protein|nr:hypothetical protein [Myxococcota bacterium]